MGSTIDLVNVNHFVRIKTNHHRSHQKFLIRGSQQVEAHIFAVLEVREEGEESMYGRCVGIQGT